MAVAEDAPAVVDAGSGARVKRVARKGGFVSFEREPSVQLRPHFPHGYRPRVADSEVFRAVLAPLLQGQEVTA